jgi:hypothetical protein
MEGSHRKGSNWYRCRFVTLRGPAAADASGHPRVVGIKEDTVLDAAFDLLGRCIFGPDRLRLLREELARSTGSDADERETELARLAHEEERFDLTATYDKEQRALRLAATLSPALIPASQRPRPIHVT